jgi:DNA ligase-1
MTLPKLFKRTAKAAIQEWEISIEEDAQGAMIRTCYGQLGGAIQKAEVRIRRGKNLGKANATTPMEQAVAEATAKWTKQKDKGYVEAVNPEKQERRPMLALDYAKHQGKVLFPCFVQPKLDGIRCIAAKDGEIVTLTSRGNKAIDTVPHINAQLLPMMLHGQVWDGELYIHGETFQAITSLVKKRQPDSELLQYHVYDTISGEDYLDRMKWGLEALYYIDARSSIKRVTSLIAVSHEEIAQFHARFVSEGYEGAMVRHSGEGYREGARSSSLLKVKNFLEQEFKIVGVNEGRGNAEGMAIFRCVTDQGVEFDCMPRGTESERRQYWIKSDNYLGLPLVVRFFEWTTSNSPVPRFPVGIGIRFFE